MLLIVLLTENVQTLTESKSNQFQEYSSKSIYKATASSSDPVIGQGQGSSVETISEPTQSSSGK